MLASLACWVLFTIPLSFIKPEPVKCIEYRNQTDYVLTYTRNKRDVSAGMNNLNQQQQQQRNELHLQASLIDPNSAASNYAAEETHSRYTFYADNFS